MWKRYKSVILASLLGVVIGACATYAPYRICEGIGCGENVAISIVNELEPQ